MITSVVNDYIAPLFLLHGVCRHTCTYNTDSPVQCILSMCVLSIFIYNNGVWIVLAVQYTKLYVCIVYSNNLVLYTIHVQADSVE